MVLGLVPQVAFAAEGDAPAHEKTLTVNPDGTYTIALNVKGDSEKQPSKANVIVVFDTSSSMNTATGNTEVTYTPTNSEGGWWYQDNLYGLIDGEYRLLTRTTTGNWPNQTYHFWYNNQEYTGQRYTRQSSNQSRLEAAEAAVNELAAALLAYNGQDGNPDDTIEIALVDFANMAEIAQEPTTDYDTFAATVNSRDAGNNDRGTNWEAGLRTALNVDFDDEDPTYVIFVSDGNPTFYVNNNGTRGGSGQETTDNVAESYNQAVPAAEALVDAGYEFYTIGVYGNVDRMESLTTASGASAENYYSASDTAALQAALAEILEAIEMAGIGNVGMADGTTSKVSTSSGDVSLLTIDETSYKYYRAGGTENGSEKYDSSANDGLGEEWTDAPEAKLEDGAVKWNIDGILENGVTYTVTFDCWPSQTTLDYVADIKNDPNFYDTLDTNIKKYLDKNGNLKTNTTATLTYTDTRNDDGPQTSEFTNPEPVSTTAVEQLAVTKKWQNTLDSQAAKPLTLDVTRDGENKYTVDLSNDNNWTDSIYISIGIIKTVDGEDKVLEKGHDFTFKEPKDLTYHWELDVPTVRPMLVNGTITMLILKDKDYTNPNGAKEYTIEGKTYYVGSTGDAKLTAVNERRSSLQLTKVVTGEDAPADTVFPFSFTIKNSLAPAAEPENDPGHDSDYWVWISVWDADKKPVNEGVTGATFSGYDGWWYTPSGTTVTIPAKAGYSIRVNNLPTDSEYTVVEGDLADGFKFVDAKMEVTEGEGTMETFEVDNDSRTATGKIESTNSLYQITYTNLYQYARLQIPVTKNLTVPQGLTGPSDITGAYTFTLTASGSAPMPAAEGGDTVTNPEAKGGTAKFGEIVYKAAGTYTYTVAETNTGEQVPGVTNDADASGKTVTVTVTENADGTLTAATDGVSFTNVYSATGTAQIPVIKNVIPANDNIEDITGKFTFTLAGTGSAPMPTATTVTSGDSGEEVNFGAITYTDVAGSFSYNVTESYSEGYSYENTGINLETTSPRTVSVVVTDNGEGELVAVVNGGNPVTFNNPYSVQALDVTIPVTKILEIPNGLTGPGDITGKYTFTLTTTNNAPLPTTTSLTNPAANGGTVTFGDEKATGKITVTAPGTYSYKVTESGTVAGVENDENAETGISFDVVVTDNGNGSMSYTVNGGEPIEFTNTYGVDPVTAKIYVEKVLTGENAPDITEAYTFTLAAGTDKAGNTSPMPTAEGGNTVKNPAADGGKAAFGDITFTAPGEYSYTVSESGEVEGVVNDANASGKTVTVTVTDNGDGTLKAESSATEETPVSFTNSYSETTITIPVIKTLDKAEGLTGPDITGAYTFTITGADGTPMPETTSYANPTSTGGSMTFGPMTFKSEGEYTYTVTETNTGEQLPGVTNDTEPAKTVTVVVSRNADGDLEAKFKDETFKQLEFVNTYKVAPAKAAIPVKKVLSKPEDALGPDDITGKYTFTLEADGEAPMPAEGDNVVTNPDKDGGVAVFGEITYTVPGTYKYTVTEEGEVAGVTNDGTLSKTVTVTVTDKKDGTLDVVVSSTEEAPLTFTNSYNYSKVAVVLQVNKMLDSPEGVTAPDITEAYTFTLNASDGAPLPTADGGNAVKNPAADGGTAKFGEIEFTKPGTYTYTIAESGNVSGVVNDKELTRTVTVTVADGKDGTLVPTVDYGNEKANAEFVNVYEVVNVPVAKTWDDADDQDGYRPDSITVNLLADGTKVQSTEIKADDKGNWSYTFENVPKYGENEKEITYTVTEEKVDEYETEISGDASKGFTITNTHEPETFELKVTKIWDDDNNKYKVRPASVTAELFANGEKVDSVELNEANKLTHTFEVPKYSEGKEIKYTVDEQQVAAGYEKKISGNAESGFEITNKFKPIIDDPPVNKVVKHEEGTTPFDATFTFKFAAVKYEGDADIDKLPMPETAKGAQEMTVDIAYTGGKTPEAVEFGEFALVEPGVYTYTISEVAGDAEGYSYTDKVYTVVYTVTANKETNALECVKTIDGQKAAMGQAATFEFTNEFVMPTVTVKVTKVWDDNNNRDGIRPTAVGVKLLANGKDSGKSIALNEANSWTYTFEDLPKYDEKQKAIAYTVEETKVPENYTAEITGDMEKGFVITNSSDVVQTGDDNGMALWSATMGVSLVAALFLALKKRKGGKHYSN